MGSLVFFEVKKGLFQSLQESHYKLPLPTWYAITRDGIIIFSYLQKIRGEKILESIRVVDKIGNLGLTFDRNQKYEDIDGKSITHCNIEQFENRKQREKITNLETRVFLRN